MGTDAKVVAPKAGPIDIKTGNPSVATDAEAKGPRPTRLIPTDRIAQPRQLDLLRTYAVASGAMRKPVSLNEVESIIKMKVSTISLANPFFVDTKLLVKTDKGFLPADAVLNFERAYQWNKETAAHKLAPVIADTWFAKRLLPKLGFRDMAETEAIRDLAEECAALPAYEPQLKTLIDYMVVSGLVIKNGNMLSARRDSSSSETSQVAEPAASEQQAIAPSPARATVSTAFSSPTEGKVQFHVSVQVDMAEFAGWQADRIAAFFGGIAQVLAAKGQLEKGASEK